MKDTKAMIGGGNTVCSAITSVSIATHYLFSIPLYKKLKKLGMTVTGFTHDKNTVAFTYIAKGRRPLDYTELLQIQELINPNDLDNYPIPIGYFGEYTLYIPLQNAAK